jgi:hypothetical protein
MGKKISIHKFKKRKLEVYHLTKLLYYFLRKHPDNIYFEKLHGGLLGYYDYGTAEITLDYRGDIISTLIHEFLHHLHPHWSETKILQKERETMTILSARQCRNIIRNLAHCF